MTETQAKSGASGASATPVENQAAENADNGTGATPTGRAVVGRASVAADPPAPKFTRPPGMNPPPDAPETPGDQPEKNEAAGATESAAASGMPTGRASVPTAGSRISVNPATSTAVGARKTPTGTPTAMIGSVGGALPATDGSTRGRGAPGGTAKVADAVRAARAAVSSAASRGPRRARLFVKRVDPWSVMKFSFAVSFVLFFVAIVATAVLYLALDAMGVWGSVNKALADMIGATGGKNGGFKITAFGVIGTAGVLGLVNVVLFTALATLSAFIYNVCADLVGGIEVTLSEKD